MFSELDFFLRYKVELRSGKGLMLKGQQGTARVTASLRDNKSRQGIGLGRLVLLLSWLLLFVPTSSVVAQSPQGPTAGQHRDTGQRPEPQPLTQEPAVTLSSQLVVVPATVTDYSGRFVKGLRDEHFEVYDEKVRQEIAVFSHDDQPVSVGIILDFSGSMGGEKLVAARQALREVVEWSHPEDEFFLIGFNDQVHLLRDFTSSADEIASGVALIKPSGRTAVYDAVYDGVEKVIKGRHTRRALLLISDGHDNSSRYTYRQLRDLVRECDVLIYTIRVFGAGEGRVDLAHGETVLAGITDLTGGRFFAVTADDSQGLSKKLVSVCQHVALELRLQYTIGFYPTEPSNGKWHRLKVRLKPPSRFDSLKVRARQGYLANREFPR